MKSYCISTRWTPVFNTLTQNIKEIQTIVLISIDYIYINFVLIMYTDVWRQPSFDFRQPEFKI